MKKVIVIDARLANLHHAGLGRYSLQLLRFLPHFAPKKFRYGLVMRPDDELELKKQLGNFYEYYPLAAAHYSWREQVLFPALLWRLKPDLTHFLHFNVPLLAPPPFVVTIHDLIKHRFWGEAATTRARWQYFLKRQVYFCVFRQAVCRARLIITPSHWTAEDLQRHYSCLKPEKIRVITEGGEINSPKREKSRLPAKIQPPYFLYVGSLYPHKNLEVVLKAWREDTNLPPLVVVAARNIFRERFWQRVKRMKLTRRVILVDFLSDSELRAVYQKAEALIFPSRLEGFGLPGLEAMANGCPVIAARSSALPETYGEAALYFNPDSSAELRRRIYELKGNRQIWQRRGREQARKYSWERMAREIVNVHKQLLS